MDLRWRNVTCEHCTRLVDGLDGIWAIYDRILLEEIKNGYKRHLLSGDSVQALK